MSGIEKVERVNEGENADDRSAGYDLGVLVVHGIGDQKQGATLTTWVNAITEWLDHRGRATSVRRARLRPADGPAHVEVSVDTARTPSRDQK